MSYLNQLFSLDGKVAVITGAVGGLGSGLTESLHKAGATAVLVDVDQQRIDTARESYQCGGLDAHSFACDLAHTAQLDALADYVDGGWLARGF